MATKKTAKRKKSTAGCTLAGKLLASKNSRPKVKSGAGKKLSKCKK